MGLPERAAKCVQHVDHGPDGCGRNTHWVGTLCSVHRSIRPEIANDTQRSEMLTRPGVLCLQF